MTEIDLSNCTSIGQDAFYNCKELTGELNLTKCKTFGGRAFHHCVKISKILFGNALEKIGNPINEAGEEYSYSFYGVSAETIFSKNPNDGISYNKWAFNGGHVATWNDNGTIRTYKWNQTTSSCDLQ